MLRSGRLARYLSYSYRTAACTTAPARSSFPSEQQSHASHVLRCSLQARSSSGWALHGSVASGWEQFHGTTVLCVRKGTDVVLMADGQVTAGSKVVKPNAKKLRRLEGGVIGGFAGGTADALTLFERLESKLEEHPGQLRRAAVELAKAWRQDKVLRRLEARMIVADATTSLEIGGNGDVLEPHDGVIAIGSGSGYAIAAARALIDVDDLDAMTIAKRAMNIAADCCIYTNHSFTWEVIDTNATKPS